MPTLARPEVDVLEGLTTAIVVDQQRMGADARSTVGTATDANAMLRILFSRLGQPHIGSPNAFSFNVPSVRASGAITVERGGGKTVQQDLHPHRRHVPALRGPGHGLRHRPDPALRRLQVARRGRDHHPRLHRGQLLGRPALHRVGLPRPGQADPQVHQEGAARLPPPRADQGEGQRRQRHLRGADPQDREVDPLQGPGGAAAAYPGVRGPGGHLHRAAPSAAAPGSARRPGRRGSAGSASPTPARCRSATWPSGSAASTSRRWRRCSRRCNGRSTRSWRSGWATSRSTGRRARCRAARRSASRDPPPRLLAHRRHLRLRRAHHGPAPP